MDSTRGGRLFGSADDGISGGGGRDNRGGSCSGSSGGYPPVSPSKTSLASSFVKAAKSLPDKARTSGAAAAASAAVVQADLLALSPRTARGAEAAVAAAAGRRYAGRGGDGGSGAEKGSRGRAGGKAANGGGVGGGGGGGGGGSWRSFFSGVLCTLLLVLGAMWTLGDPLLMSGQFGLGLTVLEDGGAGGQAVVLIHGSVSKKRFL